MKFINESLCGKTVGYLMYTFFPALPERERIEVRVKVILAPLILAFSHQGRRNKAISLCKTTGDSQVKYFSLSP
jgi:hypothetical protein